MLSSKILLLAAGSFVLLAGSSNAAVVYSESFDDEASPGAIGDGVTIQLSSDTPGGVGDTDLTVDNGVFGSGGVEAAPPNPTGTNGLFLQVDNTNTVATLELASLNLTAGLYTITFDSVARTNNALFDGDLQVSLNGVVAGTATNPAALGNIQANSLNVTLGPGDAGAFELEFLVTDPNGSGFKQPIIDNIVVDLVPEPGSLALLGLGGLALLRRR